MNKERKERYVCRIRRRGDILEAQCTNGSGHEEQFVCIIGSEGKGGGLSAFGFGGQYSVQQPKIQCFSLSEFKEELARKLRVKVEDIEWEINGA